MHTFVPLPIPLELATCTEDVKYMRKFSRSAALTIRPSTSTRNIIQVKSQTVG